MSKKKESIIATGVLSGWASNSMRKSDARVAYRQRYPKNQTRWMGHGAAPGGETRTAQKSPSAGRLQGQTGDWMK